MLCAPSLPCCSAPPLAHLKVPPSQDGPPAPAQAPSQPRYPPRFGSHTGSTCSHLLYALHERGGAHPGRCGPRGPSPRPALARPAAAPGAPLRAGHPVQFAVEVQCLAPMPLAALHCWLGSGAAVWAEVACDSLFNPCLVRHYRSWHGCWTPQSGQGLAEPAERGQLCPRPAGRRGTCDMAWPVPAQPENSFRITQQACTCASKYNKARQAPPAQPPALVSRTLLNLPGGPDRRPLAPGGWNSALRLSNHVGFAPQRLQHGAPGFHHRPAGPGPLHHLPAPGIQLTGGGWPSGAALAGNGVPWAQLVPPPPALQIASSAFSGNSAVAEFSTAAEMTEEPETTGWGQVSGLGWGGHPSARSADRWVPDAPPPGFAADQGARHPQGQGAGAGRRGGGPNLLTSVSMCAPPGPGSPSRPVFPLAVRRQRRLALVQPRRLGHRRHPQGRAGMWNADLAACAPVKAGGCVRLYGPLLPHKPCSRQAPQVSAP